MGWGRRVGVEFQVVSVVSGRSLNVCRSLSG